MLKINLFKKKNIDMNLLIGTVEKEKFNMPMYNTDITVWKGVDNTIEFSIKNHDRKAEKMPNGSKLKFVAINNQMHQVIEKELIVVNENLGRYTAIITKDELNNYDIGTFVGHVSIINEDGTEELLYSGTDWYPFFNVEVKPNRLELIEDEQVFDSSSFNRELFQDKTDGMMYEVFTSSVIKSDITPNHIFVLKLKEFIGEIKIQGSNSDNPEHNESDWFDIETKVYNDISEDESVLMSCEGKFLYTRVQYKRKEGQPSEIVEVQYRN